MDRSERRLKGWKGCACIGTRKDAYALFNASEWGFHDFAGQSNEFECLIKVRVSPQVIWPVKNRPHHISKRDDLKDSNIIVILFNLNICQFKIIRKITTKKSEIHETSYFFEIQF